MNELAPPKNAIRNVYVFIMKRLGFLLSHLSHGKRYVIFESIPDYSGSPKMICLEMEKRGLRRKYTFVWGIDKKQISSFQDYDCIPFFGGLNFFERIKKNIIKWNAVLIVGNNRAILKTNERTIRVYTEHGGPLKQCFLFTRQIGSVDYVLSLSDNLSKIDYKLFAPDAIRDFEQILVTGHPGNDELFMDARTNTFWKKTLRRRKKTDFNKVIGWFPTFRQRVHDCGDDLCSAFPFGVPILKNKEEVSVLNEHLRKNRVLLLIQIHHAQKKTYSIVDLSNIIVLEQSIKDECCITNANIMHDIDALITDYSAVYHEFLLLNRPIAITIDDYEDYLEQVGFCFDFFEYIKGFYVKNIEDLKNFITETANNIDSSRDLRLESLKKIHKYVDGNSTRRVVDFICEKID